MDELLGNSALVTENLVYRTAGATMHLHPMERLNWPTELRNGASITTSVRRKRDLDSISWLPSLTLDSFVAVGSVELFSPQN